MIISVRRSSGGGRSWGTAGKITFFGQTASGRRAFFGAQAAPRFGRWPLMRLMPPPQTPDAAEPSALFCRMALRQAASGLKAWTFSVSFLPGDFSPAAAGRMALLLLRWPQATLYIM